MTAAVVGHNPLVLVPNPRDRRDVLRTISKTRAAFLPGVPTLFASLLSHPDVVAGKTDFGALKVCISGASTLASETRKSFEKSTGCPVIEGYGLTESMMAAVIQPVKGERREGATGLPLPDVEVRIVDADTGRVTLGPREQGEIAMKAPQLMLGYYGEPEKTREVCRDGWLYTGDVGYMDEDGFVFVTARKKDMIKAGGFQVWPNEIEDVIAAIPAVAEVSVAGVPDPYRGETAKAWVVLRPGLSTTEKEILAACREKLTAYKVPTSIEFKDSLPKNAIGKVLRRVLVEEHKAKNA
jgi:long-chain acyl-CoA synthetase